MKKSACLLLLVTSFPAVATAFFLGYNNNGGPAPAAPTTARSYCRSSTRGSAKAAATAPAFLLRMQRDDFTFSFEVPKKGIADIGTAEVRLAPLLEQSELVVVRYDLPFGLNAEPDAATGQVVVTKNGTGGEQVGDILRQTTYWRGREPGIFDVSKNAANFDLVVKALVTNDLSVADDIVLVFERPL
jgi:hypothetical protein